MGFGSATESTPLAAASLTEPSVTLHGPNNPPSPTTLGGSAHSAAGIAPAACDNHGGIVPPPTASAIDSPCNLLHGLVPAPREPSISLKVSTAAGRTKAPQRLHAVNLSPPPPPAPPYTPTG